MGGHGLGGVCDHINHSGYHIKEIRLHMEDMGGRYNNIMLKGSGENTVHYSIFITEPPSCLGILIQPADDFLWNPKP